MYTAPFEIGGPGNVTAMGREQDPNDLEGEKT